MTPSPKKKTKKKKKEKPTNWAAAWKESKRMEQHRNLLKLYKLFTEIKELMEEMSPKLTHPTHRG